MARPLTAQLIRIGMYLLLFLSAGTAFLLGDRLWAAARGGALPSFVALVPVCAFTAFVLIYSVDRWMLVKRRNYPLGRAFFQVALAVLFASILWPQQAQEFVATRHVRRGDGSLARLLSHPDLEVRAAGCELAGRRGDEALRSLVEERLRVEKDSAVRDACSAALQRLTTAAPKAADPLLPTGEP